MDNEQPIIKSDSTFTPYKFYTEFLEELAAYYRQANQVVTFRLFEKGDEDIYNAHYQIDPIVIPLLLSLLEQLSKFHKCELPLSLHNNRATIDVLEFLYKSDFFYLAGNNQNPSYPVGRNIIKYDRGYFGTFKGKQFRKDHRVRGYSLADDGLRNALNDLGTEEQKRDFLISHYTYKVREHFQELLFDNDFTADIYNIYIDILSELITNSVLHSGSNAYALMFVDRFRTKFSISDNGVGFGVSMKKKEETFFYIPNGIKKVLAEKIRISNVPAPILDNLFTIFETLYYSSLKERHGLFDLMVTVVLESKGYFRIHNDNCQVIISNKMMDELTRLYDQRTAIYNLHNQYLLNIIPKAQWESGLKSRSHEIKDAFISFCEKAVARYSADIKYSSLRFFKVKFRGVHIEVEIPNSLSDDHFSD